MARIGIRRRSPDVDRRPSRRRARSGLPVSVVSTVCIAVAVAGTGIAAADRQIGPYMVGGAILVEYDQAGGFNTFGNPTTPESNAAYGGKFQVFEKSNSIYWHPDTGAHQVGGRIRDKWRDWGWETGVLHYPTTRETSTPTKPGRYNTFQGGSIYWTASTDAHEIGGSIRDKWSALGWENGSLGFPTTDEVTVNGGSFNHFQGGSIYWSPSAGAHSIWGEIQNRWADAGWEKSPYGFPTSDEYSIAGGGKEQTFQNGKITWFPNKEYDGAAAAAYADQWSANSTTEAHNPAYPIGVPDDCTNFVSQVLHEGGLGLVGTQHLNDHTEDNQWWYVQVPFENFYQTYSWTAADHLYNYLTNTNRDGHSVAKQTRYITSLAEKRSPYVPGGAMPGDVLIYDWGQGEGKSHAAVVVGRDTPFGLDQHNPNLDPNENYTNTTVIDSHTNNRHHTFWSGNPTNGDWLTESIWVIHPFQKADVTTSSLPGGTVKAK